MIRRALVILALLGASCGESDGAFIAVPADIDRVAIIELTSAATGISPDSIKRTTALARVEDTPLNVADPDGMVYVVGYRADQLDDIEPASLEDPIRLYSTDGDDVELPAPAWSVRVEDLETSAEPSLPPLAVRAAPVQRGGWVQLRDVDSPGARYRYGMAYDPVREQVVVFGGDNNEPGRLNDTWVLGDRWRAITSTIAPPQRSMGELAFDPVTERVIMFGGYLDGFGSYGDTWAFDGAWTELRGIESPPRRGGHRLVLDQRRGRVLLFGGNTRVVGHADDTWVFEGDRWEALELANRPTPRRDFGIVYHPARESVIVIGGANDDESALLADAWELTADDGWQRAPQFDLPYPRRSFAVAWDPNLELLVVHGGWDEITTYDDTIVHDGSQWRSASIGLELEARRRHQALYVPSLGAIVTVAGQTGFTATPTDVYAFRMALP